jgi:molybdopterin-guanine dinucleotide biosynthesis protein B
MTKENKEIPVVSIVGESDTGKTTLIEKIIPELTGRGYRVATVKHDAHGFNIDHEGKDSWRHKQAGAALTVLSSPRRVAVVEDVAKDHDIAELRDMYIRNVDIILTEGFKRNSHPKIEVFRADRRGDLISRGDQNLLAVAGDKPPEVGVPCFGGNDIAGIVDLIVNKFLQGAEAVKGDNHAVMGE